MGGKVESTNEKNTKQHDNSIINEFTEPKFESKTRPNIVLFILVILILVYIIFRDFIKI